MRAGSRGRVTSRRRPTDRRPSRCLTRLTAPVSNAIRALYTCATSRTALSAVAVTAKSNTSGAMSRQTLRYARGRGTRLSWLVRRRLETVVAVAAEVERRDDARAGDARHHVRRCRIAAGDEWTAADEDPPRPSLVLDAATPHHEGDASRFAASRKHRVRLPPRYTTETFRRLASEAESLTLRRGCDHQKHVRRGLDA